MSKFTCRHEINLSEIADEYAKRLEAQVDEMALDKAADTLERFGYVKVIRCRDCVHYRKHKWFKVAVGTPLGTDISDVCMFFADGCKVEPDGFCAWGERKEGGDD